MHAHSLSFFHSTLSSPEKHHAFHCSHDNDVLEALQIDHRCGAAAEEVQKQISELFELGFRLKIVPG